MTVKLKDVAKEAGVAINTASSILNSRKDSWASEETKKRVRDAAEKLGYVPNRIARGLSLGKFDTIGLIIPDLQNPFYAALVTEIENELIERNYDLVIEDTRLNFEHEQVCLDKITNRQIDGMIINPINSDVIKSHLTPLNKSGTPVVVLGESPKTSSLNSIQVDLTESIRKTIQHLVDLGHRNIGFILHSMAAHQKDVPRIAGFRNALRRHHLKLPEQFVLQCKPTIADSYRTFKTMLEAKPENLPTAFICLNDLLAIGTMRAASEAELQIPGDLSIVGVDDIPLAEFLPVSLTTISQPIREMAQNAVEAVLKKDSKPARITLSGELMIRESTGPVRKPA